MVSGDGDRPDIPGWTALKSDDYPGAQPETWSIHPESTAISSIDYQYIPESAANELAERRQAYSDLGKIPDDVRAMDGMMVSGDVGTQILRDAEEDAYEYSQMDRSHTK